LQNGAYRLRVPRPGRRGQRGARDDTDVSIRN